MKIFFTKKREKIQISNIKNERRTTSRDSKEIRKIKKPMNISAYKFYNRLN